MLYQIVKHGLESTLDYFTSRELYRRKESAMSETTAPTETAPPHIPTDAELAEMTRLASIPADMPKEEILPDLRTDEMSESCIVFNRKEAVFTCYGASAADPKLHVDPELAEKIMQWLGKERLLASFRREPITGTLHILSYPDAQRMSFRMDGSDLTVQQKAEIEKRALKRKVVDRTEEALQDLVSREIISSEVRFEVMKAIRAALGL